MVTTTVPSLLILGTDAVLAAAPSTPVQLAQACLAAGYDMVVPASWGDELIAARVVDRLRSADVPLVQCSCPLVSQRLSANGDAIAPILLCLVSPPVAAANYLRALYAPAHPRVTFVGACASGSHDSIDVWMSPHDLLTRFSERGIALSAQPTEFDSVIPPDRRRFYSEPGGVPSVSALRQLPTTVDCIELTGDDLVTELAQHLLGRGRKLIDASLRLGCTCSGAGDSVSAAHARDRVRDHEPPRALAPLVDHSLPVGLDAEEPRVGSFPTPRRHSPAAVRQRAEPAEALVAATPVAVEVPRRRSPPGIPRPVLGVMPRARTETGRQLPRAYVARRRSSPRGTRVDPLLENSASPSVAPPSRPRWIWIGAGIAAGLGLSWLLGLAR